MSAVGVPVTPSTQRVNCGAVSATVPWLFPLFSEFPLFPLFPCGLPDAPLLAASPAPSPAVPPPASPFTSLPASTFTSLPAPPLASLPASPFTSFSASLLDGASVAVTVIVCVVRDCDWMGVVAQLERLRMTQAIAGMHVACRRLFMVWNLILGSGHSEFESIKLACRYKLLRFGVDNHPTTRAAKGYRILPFSHFAVFLSFVSAKCIDTYILQ